MNKTQSDKADNAKMHNPDYIERQKPCDICGEPIGDEAMYTEVGKRYHVRCLASKHLI